MKPVLFMLLILWPRPPMIAAGDEGPTAMATAAGLERSREAGMPFLRNYDSKEYRAASQNWAIAQDRRGVIYAGNSDGLLEYDGARWRLIQTLKKTCVRSVVVDDAGTVHVGAQGEIGYLAANQANELEFVSLNDRIDAAYRSFTDVWVTLATPQGVYFHTREYLFLLSGGRIRAWESPTGFHKTFFVRGRLFTRQFDIGLTELIQGELVLTPGGERFAKEKIIVMLPWEDGSSGKAGQILIGTRTQGFFLFDGVSLTPFRTEAEDYLKENPLYEGALLDDGNLALATVGGGVLQMDRHGKILSILDKERGLPDDTVYSITVDRQTGLWFALDKGISHVEWPSPLSRFDQRSGLNGIVIAVHRYNGTLYVGTSQGVYVLVTDVHNPDPTLREPRFVPVDGAKGYSADFITIGETLLATTYEGVVEFRGLKASLVRLGDAVPQCLLRSRSDPSRVFVGMQNGLGSIRIRGDRTEMWIDEGQLPGITQDIRTMVETPDGQLWLGTEAEGVMRVRFIRDPKRGSLRPSALVERFDAKQGIPASNQYCVYAIDGQCVVATRLGIYGWDDGAKGFVPDPRFAGLVPPARDIHWLRRDCQGSIWMNSVDRARNVYWAGMAVRQPDRTYRWEETPFLRFAEMGVDVVHPDDDGVLWIGGADGLIRYDSRITRDRTPAYPALVRRVDRMGGELLHGGAPGKSGDGVPPTLKYRENALRFAFALPAFDQPEANLYQTYLEGLDTGWSVWTVQNAREYTNLWEGSYTFRVRARNVYGSASREGSFVFVVTPPLYRTWLAYSGFASLGVLALTAVIRARTHKLRREKDRLARLVNEALANIKVLRGLLPVCAWCRKVRDDQGYWEQIEKYVSNHSSAEFTHGICPECKERLEGDILRLAPESDSGDPGPHHR